MESVRLLPAVPGAIAGAPTYSTTAIGSGYVSPGLIRSVDAGALRRPSAHGIAIEQQHQHWQAQAQSQPLSWRQALRYGGPASKSAAISLGLGQRIRGWPTTSSGSCSGLSGRGFGSNLVLVRAAADGEAPGAGSVGSGAGSGSGASPLRSVSVSASASSSPAGTSTTRSDARTEKLMKMQKELLEQLEERRKLHAALLKSLDDPSKTIAAFNDSNQGGLPPVGSVAATPAAAPTQVPRPAAKAPTGPPPPAAAAMRTIPPASRPAPAAPRPGVAPPAPSPPRSIPAAPSTRPAPPPPAAAAAAPSTAPVRPATSPISVPIPSAPPPPNRGQAPPPPAPQRQAPPPPAAAVPAPAAPTRAAPAALPPRAAPAPAPAAPPPVRAPPPPAAPRPAAVVKAPVAIPSAPPLPPAVKREEAKPKPAPVAETRPADPPAEEKPPPLAGPNVMNIVMVASECAPWSKTGGLGDVVGALPKALARRGHRVMVCAPRYSAYEEAYDTGVRKRYNVAGQDLEVGYFHHYKDNVDWVFVDNNVFHHLPNIYAGSREEVTKRMTLLCKASIEACWHVPCGGVPYGDGNLVFIANDWHTALLPVYLQAYYRDHGLMQFARSILVIHNMAHQGRGPVAEYGRLGLPDHYLDRFKLYDPIGGEHMNIFMAGLISAHKIVAVSHGYAWEVQTQMGGWGLDAVLREHNQKLRGVVNGIDTVEWGPDSDSFLNEEDGYTHYDMDSLDRKAQCKAALQRELGLPVRADVPLIGFIGRLDYQKGVDIIGEAMPWITSQDCQLVLLGSGRADLEDMLRSFEGSHREKVRGWVGFSVKMAHRITAGADILLMPSRFEPCGLNQLYAMRYGTVPVVHAVGGLRDTVQGFDPFNDTGLGWTFDRAEAGGLIHALGNAMYTYREFKDSWRKLQLRGMAQDLSWDNAAQQYEEVLVAAKYTW